MTLAEVLELAKKFGLRPAALEQASKISRFFDMAYQLGLNQQQTEPKMKLTVKRLHEKAILPYYATAGAACFDICAIEEGTVYPRAAEIFKTGLAVEVPEGYALLVYSRSGHGFKYGVRLSNCVGIIDSDYRGELMVSLCNDNIVPFRVSAGDRIAQGMLVPVPAVEIVEGELSETERGDGGFGSTGK